MAAVVDGEDSRAATEARVEGGDTRTPTPATEDTAADTATRTEATEDTAAVAGGRGTEAERGAR